MKKTVKIICRLNRTLTLVVIDTTPINYLVLIGHADILPSLYGHVVLPQAVVGGFTTPADSRNRPYVGRNTYPSLLW